MQRGVLMLDEVDLLLHPLKSELNWPLGEKLPLDLTKDKLSPGLRWQLPFHCLDALFFAAEGVCVMEVTRRARAGVRVRVRVAEGVCVVEVTRSAYPNP